MKVSVFGLGYVGSVSAACLASLGHEVLGVDINADKVALLNSGRSPVIERGLEELISAGVRCGHLRATGDVQEAVAHGEVIMVCVATPSDANGNLNYAHTDRVCTQIAQALRETPGYKVIALRSTLLPGTISTRLAPLLARTSGKVLGQDFAVVMNPEFLREGSALDDFRNPPFTIIGQSEERAGELLAALYAPLPAPIYRVTPDEASMLKYASNAFHALKVTFANEMGRLCKASGINSSRVMEIFCEDTRLNISPRYLRPGFAFGGSCLPKDLRALLYLGRHNDLSLPVLEAVLPSNRTQIENAAEMILRDGRKRVGVIGLTFKPGTDDLRESPVVELVEMLSGKGLRVIIHDDNVVLSKLVGGNKAFIESVIPHISALMRTTLEEVVADSDIVVMTHNRPESAAALLRLLRPEQRLIDLARFIPDGQLSPAHYEGIGW